MDYQWTLGMREPYYILQPVFGRLLLNLIWQLFYIAWLNL